MPQMQARDYVKPEALNEPPQGGPVPLGLRRQAILDALQGVELGAHDWQTVDWLAGLDEPTSRTIVSLLLRVRDATNLGMLDLIKCLEDMAEKARLKHSGGARWAAGNSRPGRPI
jgi:hypothetical protein